VLTIKEQRSAGRLLIVSIGIGGERKVHITRLEVICTHLTSQPEKD
jgi:hypothetical protein